MAFNFGSKPTAPAGGSTFQFNAAAPAAGAAPSTPATKPGGFNFGGAAASGGFGFGAAAGQKEAPAPQKQALGLSCFNEPQAQRQTNELEYLSGQLRGNACFQAAFLAPKAATATTTAATSGFAFGAKPSGTTAAQRQLYNKNFDPEHLEVQGTQGMEQLLKKGQQTVLDTKKVLKDAGEGLQRLNAVCEMQEALLKEAGNLQMGQSILKQEFFRRFRLENYAADARIAQMMAELAGVVQTAQQIQSGIALEPADKKRFGLLGIQQENAAIDLLRRAQQ